MMIFVACSDDKKVASIDADEAIPADVNISVSETNITIDESLPPEPVMEGQ